MQYSIVHKIILLCLHYVILQRVSDNGEQVMKRPLLLSTRQPRRFQYFFVLVTLRHSILASLPTEARSRQCLHFVYMTGFHSMTTHALQFKKSSTQSTV